MNKEIIYLPYSERAILGQVWYLIVSIPDLCNLIYFCMLNKDILLLLYSSNHWNLKGR